MEKATDQKQQPVDHNSNPNLSEEVIPPTVSKRSKSTELMILDPPNPKPSLFHQWSPRQVFDFVHRTKGRRYPPRPKHLNALSLGGGIQSSAIAIMSARGELPRFDLALFADTGWEPPEVYQWLSKLDNILFHAGIPLIVVRKTNLKQDVIASAATKRRHISTPPYYSLTYKPKYRPTPNREDQPTLFDVEDIEPKDNDLEPVIGTLGRSCTRDHKIRPMLKALREILGYRRIDQDKGVLVHQWIGISTDEAIRRKPSRESWIEHIYPLLDIRRMTREDCRQYLKKNGYPNVIKSACLGCPYHSDWYWTNLKKRDPVGFEETAEIDDLIRNGLKGTKGQLSMHRSGDRLREIKFSQEITEQDDLFDWSMQDCDGNCAT